MGKNVENMSSIRSIRSSFAHKDQTLGKNKHICKKGTV